MIDLPSLYKRSEGKILTLHPSLQMRAFDLIKLAYREGILIQITQALRTIEEQEKLYAQGRTAPGPIVTWVKRSYHNFGLAFDFVVLSADGKEALWTVDDKWMEVGQLGKSLGLSWGGDWNPSQRDYPHFEYTFGLSINDLCAGKQPPKEEESVDKVTVKLDGKELQDGILYQNASYLPIRAVAEALGIKVEWDAKTKTVSLTK